MQGLSAIQLLDAWERGRIASPAERALALMEVSHPEESLDYARTMTVGRRDAALLELRGRTFGREILCLAICENCEAQLEFLLGVDDLLVPAPEIVDSLEVECGDYHVRLRLPTADDLAAVARLHDRATEHSLLERCVLQARHLEEVCPVAELPESVIEAIGDRVLACDPQAEVTLQLVCSDCGTAWQPLFDIVSFFWREIEVKARGLLREVHTLASRYGWSERDILGLSPDRRQSYIEMVVQ